MSFKEDHRELQELVREWAVIRKHNLKFKAGDPQGGLLMFAEYGLVLLILECFLRAVLGSRAEDTDTIYNLLQKATSDGLLVLDHDKGTEAAIRQLKDVRNAFQHANFKLAAKQAGCSSVREYFQNQFAPELEGLSKIADNLLRQIDAETGKRRT